MTFINASVESCRTDTRRKALFSAPDHEDKNSRPCPLFSFFVLIRMRADMAKVICAVKALFTPQGFNRVKISRLSCGVIAKANSHHSRKQNGEQHRARADRCRPTARREILPDR